MSPFLAKADSISSAPSSLTRAYNLVQGTFARWGDIEGREVADRHPN
jgi:hypothetical protein